MFSNYCNIETEACTITILQTKSILPLSFFCDSAIQIWVAAIVHLIVGYLPLADNQHLLPNKDTFQSFGVLIMMAADAVAVTGRAQKLQELLQINRRSKFHDPPPLRWVLNEYY